MIDLDNIALPDMHIIIGSGIEFISSDDEVLERSELFDLREALEAHLENREEITHVINHTTAQGAKWLYLFCVHTLEGDSGFTLMISDKSKEDALEFAKAYIEHRIESTGITKYHQINDKQIIGDA